MPPSILVENRRFRYSSEEVLHGLEGSSIFPRINALPSEVRHTS